MHTRVSAAALPDTVHMPALRLTEKRSPTPPANNGVMKCTTNKRIVHKMPAHVTLGRGSHCTKGETITGSWPGTLIDSRHQMTPRLSLLWLGYVQTCCEDVAHNAIFLCTPAQKRHNLVTKLRKYTALQKKHHVSQTRIPWIKSNNKPLFRLLLKPFGVSCFRLLLG